jgi:putative FmdB family regulatory protein
MPLYEFVCRDCGVEQEHLVRGAEQPVCEKCGGKSLAKLLSAPVAHVPGGRVSGDLGGPRGESTGGGSCGAGCGCH